MLNADIYMTQIFVIINILAIFCDDIIYIYILDTESEGLYEIKIPK